MRLYHLGHHAIVSSCLEVIQLKLEDLLIQNPGLSYLDRVSQPFLPNSPYESSFHAPDEYDRGYQLQVFK